MPQSAGRKDHPLSMRLPGADLAVIDRAARLRGRSRTEFVRDAAVRAAEDVLMEGALVRMSAAGFQSFSAAISGEPTPILQLVETLRREAPWEKGSAR